MTALFEYRGSLAWLPDMINNLQRQKYFINREPFIQIGFTSFIMQQEGGTEQLCGFGRSPFRGVVQLKYSFSFQSRNPVSLSLNPQQFSCNSEEIT